MKIGKLEIYGKSRNSKGLAFESLMKIILDSLDYTNIIPRSIGPGMEIDIEADHKTEGIHLVCECKAFIPLL